jgi:hypothetical protein
MAPRPRRRRRESASLSSRPFTRGRETRDSHPAARAAPFSCALPLFRASKYIESNAAVGLHQYTKYGWIYIKQAQNDNLTSDPPSALLRAGASVYCTDCSPPGLGVLGVPDRTPRPRRARGPRRGQIEKPTARAPGRSGLRCLARAGGPTPPGPVDGSVAFVRQRLCCLRLACHCDCCDCCNILLTTVCAAIAMKSKSLAFHRSDLTPPMP